MTWPSREARDEGMKKAMEDLRFRKSAEDMPFDGKRIVFGGFDVIVDE